MPSLVLFVAKHHASQETLTELRSKAVTAGAQNAEFKVSQGAADRRRREAALATGSLSGP